MAEIMENAPVSHGAEFAERIKKIHEKAEMMRKEDESKYEKWWGELPAERQKEYQELVILGSDSKGELEYHLRKCRYLLELISGMKSEDGRKILPVGLSIHGTLPTVLFQAQGHETKKWESLNEMVMRLPTEGKPKVYSDIDTTEYGLKAKHEDIVWNYRLDADEVQKRLTKML